MAAYSSLELGHDVLAKAGGTKLKPVKDPACFQSDLATRPNPADHPALRKQRSQSFDATFKTNMLGT